MEFREDERGVSQLIGFLFAFTIMISLVIGWQVVGVPNQNKQVEFNHYQAVQNDLQELRDAHINAGASGETRSATVQLGTTYPSRAIALNAAPASGSLQTIESGRGQYESSTVNFTNVCGLGNENDVTTKHVEYRPGYNYFNEDSAQRIENTVYYQAQDGSPSTALDRTQQVLVRPDASGGGTIAIYPLQETFSGDGTGGKTINFVGGNTGEVDVSASPFTITAPSQLSATQWENTFISDPNSEVDVSASGDDEMLDFTFTGGDWTVQCSPVGVGSAPEQAQTDAITGGGDGGNDTGSDTINPSEEQKSLVWAGATQSGGNSCNTGVVSNPNKDECTVDVELRTTGTSSDTVSIEEIRYQFYLLEGEGGQDNAPNSLAVVDVDGGSNETQAANYVGPFADVGSSIQDLSGDAQRTYRFRFWTDDDKNGDRFGVAEGDFFIVSIKYTVNGELKRGTYFIGIGGS